jgi:hypothetical protein
MGYKNSSGPRPGARGPRLPFGYDVFQVGRWVCVTERKTGKLITEKLDKTAAILEAKRIIREGK